MHTEQSIGSCSDEELISLAQSGNDRAAELIMLRYKSLVYFTASKYYMSGMENDDIVQEGMIGLYNAVLDFKPGKTSFKSFAVLCVSRRIISLLKASTRQKHIPLNSSVSLDMLVSDENCCSDLSGTSAGHNPESILISRETLLHYENQIKNKLSTLELKVLHFHLSGMSYKSISELLGKNVKSVDNAVQRTKKKLEAVLTAD